MTTNNPDGRMMMAGWLLTVAIVLVFANCVQSKFLVFFSSVPTLTKVRGQPLVAFISHRKIHLESQILYIVHVQPGKKDALKNNEIDVILAPSASLTTG